MARIARYCTPLRSRWLAMAILLCDDSLAILFKHRGICCWYPRTTGQPSWYRSLVGAPSPGHWLHRNLYRIQPYQIIALPCPPSGCGVSTPCCPAIPTVVHLTIGSGLGVVPLTFDAPSDAWLGSNSVHGHTVNWSWQCVDAGGGNFTFTLTAHWPDGCSLTDARFVCDICNCSPLHFHYLLTGGVPCGFAVGEVDDLDVTL